MKISLPGLMIGIALTGCGYTPAPEVETTLDTMKEVAAALEAFKKDHRRYPVALADLVTRPKYLDPKTTKWPANGYLKAPPKDGWNKDFTYRAQGSAGHPFELISLGEDGKYGGKKGAQDLSHFPPPASKK